MACADYVDALIVRQSGYVSPEMWRSRCYEKAISYGKNRYLYTTKKGTLKRRTENFNIRELDRLKALINVNERKEMAEYDIRECERYFHGSMFALTMPNTNVDWLIGTLKQRARNHERIFSGYKPNYL